MLFATIQSATCFRIVEAGETQLVFKRFHPSDDAAVWGCCVDENYGGLENITIGAGASLNDASRIFIKFNNLSLIAPGSIIESAILYIYVYDPPSSKRQVNCHRVSANWTESTVTWRNQPDVAELVAFETVSTVQRWLAIDLKDSVAKIVSKDASDHVPNYGWRLSDRDESNSSEVSLYSFFSKECKHLDMRPFLEVKYYPPRLELTVSDRSMHAGSWVKMTVSRRTSRNEPVTSGKLRVILGSSSTSAKFSLSPRGEPVSELTIPPGSDSVEFWYYDDSVGTSRIYVRTEDYSPYGGDHVSIVVNPRIEDNSPPVTTIIVGDPKYRKNTDTYISGSTDLTLHAEDDASGVVEVKYRIGVGPWNTYTEKFNLSSYDDGAYVIEYYSVDNAGNSESPKVFKVILDKTPPLISNASPNRSLTQESASVTFTVSVEDEGSGVGEVRIIVDGSPQGVMEKSGDVYTKTLSLGEGEHTWSIEAVDNVGNTASVSYSFTLTVSKASTTIWLYVFIVIIIVIVAISALALKRRRR
ncbi:MAG: DNRLRE domain-containing protein [Nitrososphaerota archaeon]